MRLNILSFGLLMSFNSFAFCFDEAGERYNVNPKLLKSIAQVESALKPDAINRSNTNGSYDIGLMQINSTWLKKLKQYNITEAVLLNDPCVNVNVGAWILSDNFARHGYNKKSLGAYNAGFAKNKQTARNKYIEKVEKQFYQ